MDNFGERLKDALKEKNITQRELAREINITEVTMSRYISGDRTPKAPVIVKMAQALDVSCDYLLGNTINPDAPVVVFCNNGIARKFIQESPDIADSLVVSNLLPDSDAIVVKEEEFLTWLYEKK